MANIEDLSFRIEKKYDIADNSAEKYDILAYFKEQERAKNAILNAAVGGLLADDTPKPLSLSQQVAMGITNPAPETPAAVINNTIQQGKQKATQIRQQAVRIMHKYDFSTTDLLLCIIAFLLFLILITRN